MAQKKKIVAIIFTSLVDYQKLAKKDSKLALELLSEHDTVLSKIISQHSGRVVKHINESIFAEFPSATDATKCSLDIQQSLKKINEVNPPDFQINVGIGIHMAEVYEEKGDLFGDGINLAARIKSISYKDEILTTQAVYNSIRSEKDMFIRDLGRVVLKNIEDPERVFKIYNNKNQFDAETLDMAINNMQERGVNFFDYKQHTAGKNIKICMHYINNLGEKDDNFLCFGITDSINIELNKINNIITPTTANILKLKDVEDITELSNKLDIEYLLQGSLMKMDKQFRLSVRMTNTINSKELWSENWEGKISNLESIKENILIKILESLGVELPKDLEKRARDRQNIDPVAYELTMKAKYAYLNAKNATDLDIAGALYKQAFEQQPDYLTPRNYYALILFRLKKYDAAISSLEAAENIGKQNNDSVGLLQIYNTFGIIYKQMGKYSKSITYLKEGLRLATALERFTLEANILNTLGQCYTNMTNPEKAIGYLKRSIQIKRQFDKPVEIANSLGNLAIAYRRTGDYAKAISLWEESIEITKSRNIQFQLGRSIMNYANLLYYIGRSDIAHKKYLEAMKLCKQFNLDADVGLIYRHLGLIELNNNNPKEAISNFLKANKTHQETKHQIAKDTTTLFLAQAYLYNDDLDNASKYIKQAVMLTNRRRHADQTNSFTEYYTLPSRCVQALINAKLHGSNNKELDELLNEIKTLHQEKHKSRELWWLAQGYYFIKKKQKAKECQKLAQNELQIKAGRIRDKKIKKDYLELPPLHKQIFMKIEDAIMLHKIKKPINQTEADTQKNKSNAYKFCPNCGFNNQPLFKFCPECGTSLLIN